MTEEGGGGEEETLTKSLGRRKEWGGREVQRLLEDRRGEMRICPVFCQN